MRFLKHLFQNNEAWAQRMRARDPAFFSKLSGQQSPEYLWIGCSDSRVPANQIVGLVPGEVFVHRNVANVVVHTDLNCLSVLQYAVEVLRVKHVMVVGHYGCGGVLSALRNDRLGLIDNWLRHVQDVRLKHLPMMEAIASHASQADRLCELNVIEQALNVCQTTVVQEAWARQQPVTVHGWIYSLADGRLRDLDTCIAGQDELVPVYSQALARLG
ncbi:MAG: carbonate dehydratase [Gammaproteobacteria bacterium]|nr:carbonate dehydratase [Gammaproteobacteria bacterium]